MSSEAATANEGSKLIDSRTALAKEVEGVRHPRGVKRSRTIITIITIPKSRRVIFVLSDMNQDGPGLEAKSIGRTVWPRGPRGRQGCWRATKSRRADEGWLDCDCCCLGIPLWA